MANDFGTRGGLVPYSSNNLTPIPRQTQTVASKELGDIIINSFSTLTEAFSEGDVLVNAKDIENAVTRGINKSKLTSATTKNKNSTLSSGSSSGNTEYDKYWKAKTDELLSKREKAEKLERERESKLTEGHVKNFYNNINSAVSNPLKGFSDLLDFGATKLGAAAVNLWNKPIFSSSENETVKQDSNADEESVSDLTPEYLGSLIEDSVSKGQVNANASNPTNDIMSQGLDALITEGAEGTEALAATGAETAAATGTVAVTGAEIAGSVAAAAIQTGLIAAGVLTVVTHVPMILAKISAFVDNIPREFNVLRAEINTGITGPYGIKKQIELGIMSVLNKVPYFRKKIVGMSDEDSSKYDSAEKKFNKSVSGTGGLTELASELSRSKIDSDEERLISDDDYRNSMIKKLQSSGHNVDKYLTNKAQRNFQAAKEAKKTKEEIEKGYENFNPDIDALQQQQALAAETARIEALVASVRTEYDLEATRKMLEPNQRAFFEAAWNKRVQESGGSFKFEESTGLERMIKRGEHTGRALENIGISIKQNLVGSGVPTSAVSPQ